MGEERFQAARARLEDVRRGEPIAVRGLLLGSLAVEAQRPHDERDRQVVVEVAQRIAAAIDGSRAYASAKAA